MRLLCYVTLACSCSFSSNVLSYFFVFLYDYSYARGGALALLSWVREKKHIWDVSSTLHCITNWSLLTVRVSLFRCGKLAYTKPVKATTSILKGPTWALICVFSCYGKGPWLGPAVVSSQRDGSRTTSSWNDSNELTMALERTLLLHHCP